MYFPRLCISGLQKHSGSQKFTLSHCLLSCIVSSTFPSRLIETDLFNEIVEIASKIPKDSPCFPEYAHLSPNFEQLFQSHPYI